MTPESPQRCDGCEDPTCHQHGCGHRESIADLAKRFGLTMTSTMHPPPRRPPCPICNDRGIIPGDLVEYGSTMTPLPDTICECQDET